jgi:hypothetical protein
MRLKADQICARPYLQHQYFKGVMGGFLTLSVRFSFSDLKNVVLKRLTVISIAMSWFYRVGDSCRYDTIARFGTRPDGSPNGSPAGHPIAAAGVDLNGIAISDNMPRVRAVSSVG